jgi:glutathione S-transferase
MWANIVENDGLFAIAEVLRNLSPGFRDHVLPGPVPYPQIPALIGRGRQRTEQFFDRVERSSPASNCVTSRRQSPRRPAPWPTRTGASCGSPSPKASITRSDA